jgi:hypothetical protein
LTLLRVSLVTCTILRVINWCLTPKTREKRCHPPAAAGALRCDGGRGRRVFGQAVLLEVEKPLGHFRREAARAAQPPRAREVVGALREARPALHRVYGCVLRVSLSCL